MKYPLEDMLPYQLLALLVLAVFYGIYFVKLIVQRSHGIQTHQIGSRSEKEIHQVETWMSIATVGVVAAQLLSILFDWNYLPANARFTGFFIGMLGDMIFLISVITMKDSWRAGIPKTDRTELITTGIYRYSRNPAFLGFDLQYMGLLLMYGNFLTAGFSIFAMSMLHMQILQEEKYLTEEFGETYLEYKKQVFRYLGRIKNTIQTAIR